MYAAVNYFKTLQTNIIMTGLATAGRIFSIITAISIGIIAILFIVLWISSSGKTRPLLDADGHVLKASISAKLQIPVNGVQQGMFITGKDTANPVLLFLHGGTGMPEYFLTQKYPTGLEEHFTVCWWDRCGAGLSYHKDIPAESLTIEQAISDAIAVTHYLRKRFKQNKIYLMGHSGGTFFGLQVADRAPELYAAYIGIGQMTYQLESENLSYQYVLKQYREIGNSKMVRILEAAPVTMAIPLPESYMRIRDKAMHELGVGTTRDMKSVMTGVFLRSWLNREYTLREKLGFWRGKFMLDRLIWSKMIATDLRTKISRVNIPVYFLHGKYDHTVSYPMAKAYLDALNAPVKGFYTFTHSAHSPMFEEPEKMEEIILNDVFNGTNGLADEN